MSEAVFVQSFSLFLFTRGPPPPPHLLLHLLLHPHLQCWGMRHYLWLWLPCLVIGVTNALCGCLFLLIPGLFSVLWQHIQIVYFFHHHFVSLVSSQSTAILINCGYLWMCLWVCLCACMHSCLRMCVYSITEKAPCVCMCVCALLCLCGKEGQKVLLGTCAFKKVEQFWVTKNIRRGSIYGLWHHHTRDELASVSVHVLVCVWYEQGLVKIFSAYFVVA